MEQFLERLKQLPSGYSEGRYNDRRYGVTLSVSQDGRTSKLFAEELGGKDRISFNLYLVAECRPLLKPCEMPAQKVIDFVLGYIPAT